jgi:hypothetical protein
MRTQTFAIGFAGLGFAKSEHKLEASDVDSGRDEETDDLSLLIGGTQKSHGQEVGPVRTLNTRFKNCLCLIYTLQF